MMAQNNFPVTYTATSTMLAQETTIEAEASRVRDAAHTAYTHPTNNSLNPLDDWSAIINELLESDVPLSNLSQSELLSLCYEKSPESLQYNDMDYMNNCNENVEQQMSGAPLYDEASSNYHSSSNHGVTSDPTLYGNMQLNDTPQSYIQVTESSYNNVNVPVVALNCDTEPTYHDTNDQERCISLSEPGKPPDNYLNVSCNSGNYEHPLILEDALILRSPDSYPQSIFTTGKKMQYFRTIRDHQKYIKKRESNNDSVSNGRRMKADKLKQLPDRVAALEAAVKDLRNAASQPRAMLVKKSTGEFSRLIVVPTRLMAQPIINVCASGSSESINRNAGTSSTQLQPSRNPPTEIAAPANKRQRRN